MGRVGVHLGKMEEEKKRLKVNTFVGRMDFLGVILTDGLNCKESKLDSAWRDSGEKNINPQTPTLPSAASIHPDTVHC